MNCDAMNLLMEEPHGPKVEDERELLIPECVNKTAPTEGAVSRRRKKGLNPWFIVTATYLGLAALIALIVSLI